MSVPWDVSPVLLGVLEPTWAWGVCGHLEEQETVRTHVRVPGKWQHRVSPQLLGAAAAQLLVPSGSTGQMPAHSLLTALEAS